MSDQYGQLDRPLTSMIAVESSVSQGSRRNGWAEVNPLARHWAGNIRESLDQIHESDTLFQIDLEGLLAKGYS